MINKAWLPPENMGQRCCSTGRLARFRSAGVSYLKGARVLGFLALVFFMGVFSVASQTGESRARIYERDNFRYLESNGLPDHDHGEFPNAHNPNRIRQQQYRFRMALSPATRSQSIPLGRYLFGVALNGVPFDPGTAEFWNRDPRSGWRYEAMGSLDLGLDQNHAHVQPDGSYHYHALPVGLISHLREENPSGMLLLGYAADGFSVFDDRGRADPMNRQSAISSLRSGYRLRTGQRPGGPGGTYDGTFIEDYEFISGSGDLDECNGHVGLVPGSDTPIYHYHLTGSFPFIPRCFRGEPDPSFQHRGGPPGPHPHDPRQHPPRERPR